MKIALIREGKRPIDRRVPLTPEQCVEVQKLFPEVEIVAQPSPIRCFSDSDYTAAGIKLQEDLSDCDVLLGVKEVPIEELIADKMYFFFSHTIKKQDYNRELLRAILKRNITLVDYEVLTNEDGKRVIAFGRYAGIVGAYNGIWTYGKRLNLYDIKRAHECLDMKEMQGEYEKVKLPPIKIAVTGSGRVSGGAWEVLDGIGIRRVEVDEYLNESFDEPVYVSL
ncbi:MAG: NAD(P)-dependent oxidoreductase, partial [Bacteroidota bacterium]